MRFKVKDKEELLYPIYPLAVHIRGAALSKTSMQGWKFNVMFTYSQLYTTALLA